MMKIGTVVLTLVALLAGSARAESDTLGGWKFTIAPYSWLSEIHGDVQVGDQKASPTVDFDDVFELMFDGDLLAGSGHFEGQYEDRIAMFLDVVGTYADPGRTGRAGVSRGIETSMTLLETGGAYRVLEHAIDAERVFAIEPLAGARWIHTKNELTIETSGILGEPRETERESKEDLVEPFLGSRFAVGLLPKLTFTFRGDVGGFGVGSDLSWQIVSTFLYELPWQPGRTSMQAAAGYRLLDFNWEDGSKELDLQFRGPLLGLVVRF